MRINKTEKNTLLSHSSCARRNNVIIKLTNARDTFRLSYTQSASHTPEQMWGRMVLESCDKTTSKYGNSPFVVLRIRMSFGWRYTNISKQNVQRNYKSEKMENRNRKNLTTNKTHLFHLFAGPALSSFQSTCAMVQLVLVWRLFFFHFFSFFSFLFVYCFGGQSQKSNCH